MRTLPFYGTAILIPDFFSSCFKLSHPPFLAVSNDGLPLLFMELSICYKGLWELGKLVSLWQVGSGLVEKLKMRTHFTGTDEGTQILMCIYIYMCAHLFTCNYVCICMHVFFHLCMSALMYVCICIYMFPYLLIVVVTSSIGCSLLITFCIHISAVSTNLVYPLKSGSTSNKY